MYLKSKVLYLHVESPLHAGAGSGLGAIDLPIQRERSTGYPTVHASGIKGALRDALKNEDSKMIEAVFGPDPESKERTAHAGAFSPGDARILLFPVRSLKGVFAWTTSANVLRRWARELGNVYDKELLPEGFSAPRSTEETDYCFASSYNVITSTRHVILEEFAFEHQENQSISAIAEVLANMAFPEALDPYWKNLIKTNLVILPDDAFKDFVTYSTEVITRTRLDPDSKTVVRGALWTEEHLPVDTVLYTPMRATRIRMESKDILEALNGSPEEQAEKVLTWLKKNLGNKIQLGGDETIGRGLVNLNWIG
jgi:CRISPR-associated protein Cmr4